MPEQDNISPNPNVAAIGLNMDSSLRQTKTGELSFALNAILDNFDGQEVSYQNEQANVKCLDFPIGYRVIGQKNIIEQGFTLYMLSHPQGESEIGKGINNSCIYEKIINDPCLGFDINFPIHKMVYKVSNCGTEVYWTDANERRRFINLNKLPYKEIVGSDECTTIISDEIDCNKLNVQPDFSIPELEITSVDSDGELEAGTYQFAFQYGTVNGEAYTSFYSITNPLQIFDPNKITNDFNYKVGKSINVSITNIDTTFYDYFNLAVIKTVNGITTPELVGTFQITKDNFKISYTGQSKTNIPLSIDDIFQKYPVYDVADDIFSVGDVLGWAGLKTSERISYQKIANQITIGWQTWRTPVINGYNNALHTATIRSYMRDEVYPFEICFLLTNGLQVDGFHIPGRETNNNDLEGVSGNDVIDGDDSLCDENNTMKKRWEVYNTATITGRTTDGKFDVDPCYSGLYEYGEMSYWESTDTYPCNQDIWGELAGKPIRHHKFPDSVVTHIHDNEGNIYPIGVRINVQQIKDLIANSDLTEEQKSKIAGFKIVRGNRANNKSIVAKGLINNVGKYVREETTYYFPNYPYNDLRTDPFLSSRQTSNDSGDNNGIRLSAFSTEESKNRWTLHSPDTSFSQPTLGNILKLETVEFGESKGHFQQVQEHAKYKLLTLGSYLVSLGIGIAVGFASGTIGDVIFSSAQPFEGNAAFVAYNSLIDVLEKVTPKKNYAYQFNSIGEYTDFIPIPNNGNKQRILNLALYLLPGMRSVGDAYTINNFQRESSVYLRTTSSLPFPNEQGAPEDQSRWVLSDNNCESNTLLKPISSYYASIKKQFDNQYGQIYSYKTIDTGFQEFFTDEPITDPYRTVFGGDTFINRFAYKTKLPFFIDNRVKSIDESDVFYNELGNVAFPTYWMSTDNRQEGESLPDASDLLLGIVPIIGFISLLPKLRNLFQTFFGVKKNNFDCDVTGQKLFYQDGKIYLFAYGIPYFYCESEVNVDNRQAYNGVEGDFFPRVGSDIPDEWLQEKNTTILQDNTYTYNRSFFKQNDENYFSHLPNDFTNEECRLKYPKRIITSEIRDDAINFERRNNWLIYKPSNYFDLPQNHGNLISVDGIETRQVLVRFENKSLLYNALYTAATSAGEVYLGKSMFDNKTPPLDYADTDIGYAGTQHKMLLKTEHGHIGIDANAGQVMLYQGSSVKPISNEKVSKFLVENLKFSIKNSFPDINVDNHFNGIGLHGVFDTKYNRLIFTKLDYAPIDDNIILLNNKFYLNGTEVQLTNVEAFCNKSFTLSYDFDNRTWISFHSYVPNFYIGESNYFFSGINGETSSIWTHNTSKTLFNNFYGVSYPYVIEYPKAFDFQDEILQNVKDYTKVLQYDEDGNYIELDDVWFDKAIISNNQQSSGVLKLTKKPKNNLQAYNSYPKYNIDSKEILFTKSDNFYNYNTFWGMVRDKKFPIWINSCNNVFKELNQFNMDYSKRSFKKEPLRGRDLKIRHILERSDVKLISQFILSPTQKSYK